MKRWIALVLAQVAILALVFWPDSYTELRIFDILSLGTGYRAKEMCTCMFVLERSEEICNLGTKDISLNAAFNVDLQKKSIVSSYQWLGSALPLFPSEALFQNEKLGCLLQR